MNVTIICHDAPPETPPEVAEGFPEAVAAFCLRCQGGQRRAARECRDESCPLWPYRGNTQ